MSDLREYTGRLLNHLEILYRPGEEGLTVKCFELLGCRVENDPDSVYQLVYVDPTGDDVVNNTCYISPAREEQVALEAELVKCIGGNQALAEKVEAYRQKAFTAPHGKAHFGIRIPSFAKLEAIIARIENDTPPELQGRIQVASVFRPSDEGSMTSEIIQAFVFTDVFATGPLCFGQMIELQAQEREVSEVAA